MGVDERVERIEESYSEYAQMIYKYFLFLSQDPGISEELTQETFYQAIKSISKFRNECSIPTWLSKIAKNTWYRYLKKHTKDKNKSYNLENLNTISCDEPSSLDLMISREQTLLLYKKIHDLSDKSKEVVLLRLVGDLSFREIGDICNKSEVWARVTFYRARQKLKMESD